MTARVSRIRNIRREVRRVAGNDPETIELLLACISFGWFVALLAPNHPFGNSLSFVRLLAIMPEELWGVMAGCGALLKIIGWFTYSRWCNIVSLAWSAGFWMLIGILITVSSFPNQGAAAYFFLSLFAIWAGIRNAQILAGER